MYPSVDEQPKQAGGSYNYENPSHPIHGYPQPATTVGVPACNAYNNTNNYPQMPIQQQQGHPSTWTAELCGCCDDCSSCCLTCWCPCITFGQIAEILDSGSTSIGAILLLLHTFKLFSPSAACGISGTLYALLLHFTGCACCYSCFYRKRLRSKFNLEEKPCGDCLVHFFCECCALCQEYRELKNRGFDPSLGWVGNLERQDQAASRARFATAPPLSEAMNR